MGDLADFGGSLLECLLTTTPVTCRMTNHPKLPGTEGFLRLMTFGAKTGRVPSKLEQAGHPRWATFYFPSYCSFYSYRFSDHPHHTDSLGWSPISLLGSPVGQESKELQASTFSHVVHIWCTRNTPTSFALTNYGSHSWSQYGNSPLLLCPNFSLAYFIYPGISQMWVGRYCTSENPRDTYQAPWVVPLKPHSVALKGRKEA